MRILYFRSRRSRLLLADGIEIDAWWRRLRPRKAPADLLCETRPPPQPDADVKTPPEK